jgi:hypothetical protein
MVRGTGGVWLAEDGHGSREGSPPSSCDNPAAATAATAAVVATPLDSSAILHRLLPRTPPSYWRAVARDTISEGMEGKQSELFEEIGARWVPLPCRRT